MNKGIEILLERMKSNPEEFVVEEGVVGKWDNIVRAYENVLPPEDVEVFKKARNVLLQQQFTSEVMKELLDPKPLANPYLVQPSATRLGGQTLGAYSNTAVGTVTLNSLTLGDTTLSEAGLRQMLATHKLMRVEKKSKRWWNKSIPELFGTK